MVTPRSAWPPFTRTSPSRYSYCCHRLRSGMLTRCRSPGHVTTRWPPGSSLALCRVTEPHVTRLLRCFLRFLVVEVRLNKRLDSVAVDADKPMGLQDLLATSEVTGNVVVVRSPID